MDTIRIIGLGTGGIEDLTLKAYNGLMEKIPTFLRTNRIPIATELEKNGIEYVSFDEFFEKIENFDKVFDEIADRLVDEVKKHHKINYCVPGSPFVGDIVTKKFQQISFENIKVEIIDGESFIGKCIKMSGMSDYKKINIIDPSDCDEFSFDVNALNIIVQVENKNLLSEIKINLLEIYPDDYEVLKINVLKNFIEKNVVFSMDLSNECDFSTYFCIFPIDICKKRLYNVDNLCRIVKLLRGPNGCPWDRKQTPESCKDNVLEEAKEVVEAIEKGDLDNLCEELGDLLLQVIFQSEMSSEEGYFNINDVYNGVCEKLIRRHPHVFGDSVATTPEEALEMWKKSKEKEKNNLS